MHQKPHDNGDTIPAGGKRDPRPDEGAMQGFAPCKIQVGGAGQSGEGPLMELQEGQAELVHRGLPTEQRNRAEAVVEGARP